MLRAACLGRLMGGAGVYVGYADGGADLTLPPREGAEVAFLEVFHRYELTAVESSRVRDTSDPQYGRPQVWTVTGQNRTGLTFHTSRMVTFPGQPRADDFEATAAVDRDWWDSILQSIWEDAQRYGVFWQAVSHLMQISSVGVLSISGLIDMIASQNQADAEARIDLLNEALSLTRLLLLDASKNESYKREAVSFADVPGLLQELQLATAGAVDMPVTKLFGRAPAGMNATGDSDVRGWYDSVDTWRERVLKPRAEDLIGRCERRSDVEIEWPPLWEPTEKECAEVKKIETDRAQVLWSMDVATPAEIRQSLHERKPLEDLLSGAPPEPRPVVAPGENASAPADPEAEDEETVALQRDLRGDSLDREDATAADIERRLARIAIRGLREDPDALAEVAGPGGDVGDVRAHLVQRAKDMLPDLAEVQGERKALLKEVRQLKTFKAEITKETPELAKTGAQHYAENERRATQELVDDPDKVNAIRLPGDRNGAATYAENKKRQAEGKPIVQGPRGGRYYISVGGSKTYV